MTQNSSRLEVLEPSQASQAFVATRYAVPSWATGYISQYDARFLFDIIADTKPATIVEIGVASGVSTLFILRAIEHLGLEAVLHSFDVSDRYYADPARRVGEFVLEQPEQERQRLRLYPGVSSMRVADRLPAASTHLVFIDGNHNHPWPCLDLIALLPVLRPGAWVALHDVNLPLIHPEFPCFGPQRLLASWTGEKRIFRDGKEKANTGAIRLHANPQDSADALLATMGGEWDAPVDPLDIDEIWPRAAFGGADRVERLRAIIADHSGTLPPASPVRDIARRVKRFIGRRIGR